MIELLATIVILGIIMIVAVPNVTGIIYRNRSNTYVEDAKKMVTLADYAIRGSNNNIVNPADGNCIAFSLHYLDNDEFEEPQKDGGGYQKNDSFVVVKKEGTKLVYYDQIVEEFKSTYRRVRFTTSSSLNQEGAANKLVVNFDSGNMKGLPSATGDVLNYVKNFEPAFTCTFDAVYG